MTRCEVYAPPVKAEFSFSNINRPNVDSNILFFKAEKSFADACKWLFINEFTCYDVVLTPVTVDAPSVSVNIGLNPMP